MSRRAFSFYSCILSILLQVDVQLVVYAGTKLKYFLMYENHLIFVLYQLNRHINDIRCGLALCLCITKLSFFLMLPSCKICFTVNFFLLTILIG